jgi:hypothetical protein
MPARKKAPTPKAPPTRTVQKYGWVPDLPDQRDFLYAAPSEYQQNIPKSVDLSKKCPPIYDQGQLGSCTANAIAAAIEFEQKKKFVPSRLFIYYNERVIENTVASDSGAQIRDGIKSVANRASGKGLAIRDRQIQRRATHPCLQGRQGRSGHSLPAADSGSQHHEGVPGLGISVCFWLHRIQLV